MVSLSRSQTAFTEVGYSFRDAENFSSGVDRLVLSAETSNQERASGSFGNSREKTANECQKDSKPRYQAGKRKLFEVNKLVGTNKKKYIVRKAVYNTDTKGIITVTGSSFSVFHQNVSNNEIELTRKMEWNEMRDSKTDLLDIASDINNNLFVSIYRRIDGKNSVEIVNQNNLKMIKELDTAQLLNGDSSVDWFLCANEKTVIVAVLDRRSEKQEKWCSVTVNFDQVRQYTVPLDVETDGLARRNCNLLVNETTLILSCGASSNKVAVISLPSYHTYHKDVIKTKASSKLTTREMQSKSIKYLRFCGFRGVFSLVWIPSSVSSCSNSSCSNSSDGHLFASDDDDLSSTVFNTHFEIEMDKLKNGEGTELNKMMDIETFEKTSVLCNIDNSYVFALSDTTDFYEGSPSFIKLDFNP